MSDEKRSKKAIRATLVAVDAAIGGRPLALSLSEAFAAEGKLGPGERRAAARASRGILRMLRPIELALGIAAERAGVKLKKIAPHDRTLLRYLALRVVIEGEAPARSLAELALPGPRRPRAIDDRTLAAIATALPTLDVLPLPPDPIAAVAARRSVPDFIAQRLAADLGVERADAVLAALNEDARFDLRANRLLATREEVASRLAAESVQTRPCPYARDGLIADDRAGLFGKTHAAGLFEVQDEGAQLLVNLCGAQPGETAIDLCAGSGGKTLALAADVAPDGEVIACDAIEGRLRDMPARLRRARARKLVTIAGVDPDPALKGRADVVLADVPCSGLGSLRRETDLRWRLKRESLETLPALQLEILERAASFVRKGGRLVYATCSPLRLENEEVVAAFLERHPAFRLENPATTLGAAAQQVTEGGFLRTWPDRHGTGGFFGALLVRSR